MKASLKLILMFLIGTSIHAQELNTDFNNDITFQIGAGFILQNFDDLNEVLVQNQFHGFEIALLRIKFQVKNVNVPQSNLLSSTGFEYLDGGTQQYLDGSQFQFLSNFNSIKSFGFYTGLGYNLSRNNKIILFPALTLGAFQSLIKTQQNVPQNFSLNSSFSTNVISRKYTLWSINSDISVNLDYKVTVSNSTLSLGGECGYRFALSDYNWKYGGDAPIQFPNFNNGGLFFAFNVGFLFL